MPKAILALRSYPLAILMALLLFACSLLLASRSTGIIGGGNEDGGSGMGGTGRSEMPGDSGFGGTGGPRPFLGEIESAPDNQQDEHELSDTPSPWLPRETETATIPEEIVPLLEMQRNPLRDPTLPAPSLTPEDPDALRILELDTSGLPSHLRQQLDLATSGEAMTESAPVEIHLQIPEISAPDPLDIPALTRQTQPQQATLAETPTEEALFEVETDPSVVTPEVILTGETAPVSSQLPNGALAERNETEIPEIVTEAQDSTDPRATTERVQRPELPPFQRMRPAVDRTTIAPASRPQPMRI